MGNSFHLVTTSNKIQPLSSKSLPSITSRANYLITKKEEQFVSEKPNCSSAEFDKKGIAQQPRHHVTKIYLSERHSRNLMGIPAAPPCTPFLGKLLAAFHSSCATGFKQHTHLHTIIHSIYHTCMQTHTCTCHFRLYSSRFWIVG